MPNKKHFLVLCIVLSVVCVALTWLCSGLLQVVCRLKLERGNFCWTSGSILSMYLGIAVCGGWIVFLKTIKEKPATILIWLTCVIAMNMLALCACFAAMTQIFYWVLPLL